MAVDLENERGRPVPLHDQGGIDRRQLGPRKDDINNRTPDGMHDAARRDGIIRMLFEFQHAFGTLRADRTTQA